MLVDYQYVMLGIYKNKVSGKCVDSNFHFYIETQLYIVETETLYQTETFPRRNGKRYVVEMEMILYRNADLMSFE